MSDNDQSKTTPQTPQGLLLRYMLAVAAVAAGMALRLAATAWVGPGLPTYVTFYPAVMAAALLAGFGPGLAATALTDAIAAYWILPPIWQFSIVSPVDRLGLAIFTGMGLFISVIARFYRHYRDKAAAYDREAVLRESQMRLATFAEANETLERRVAERTKELAMSEQRLQRSQEIAHLGSWELDLLLNKLTWSDEVYRIFGLQPQEFGATYEAFLDRVHPEDRNAVDAAYSDSLKENRDMYEIEHRVVRKDTGEIRVVHEKCQHLRDASGKIVRSIGMVHDITERKRAEDALRQTANELAQSNKELEQFAYVASHDLQEPLRMVTAFAGLLRDRCQSKLDEKDKEHLAFVAQNAQRMQTLVHDLLEYSRVTGKKREFAPTNVQESLLAALANLQTAIKESGATVTHDPLPVVMGDRGQLMLVFQNLIANAIKFRRTDAAPEVRISARTVNDGELGNMGAHKNGRPDISPARDTFWLFSVRDNGIGIAPMFSEKIFEVFQRLHTREEYPGTGIGLAICKKTMERHGGRIWVESEPGKGSTFHFTVPAAPDSPSYSVS